MKKITLKKLLIIYVLAMSLIVFPFLYFEIKKIFNSSFEKNATENAESVAKQTFNSMFQIMKRGWSRQDLIEFLSSIKNSQKNYDIEIYRTEIVEKLFGKINQPSFDKEILKTIREKKSVINKESGILRYIMPLKAKQVCLKCHVNAKIGDVLGVVEVKYNLGKFSSSAEKEFSKALLLTIPLPLIVVILIGYFITERIKTGLKKLNGTIENISELEDFRKILKEDINFMFDEFNELFEDIKKIVQKLCDIAVDKEILEFEIKLLEKFILTSDVIKDWKEYVMMLLAEINKVIPTYSIFSIFKEEGIYEVEVFWIGKPSEKLRIRAEEILKEKIREHFALKHEDILEINHNIAEKDKCILNLENNEIDYQVKTLFLENPRIGGIVGVGVQPDIKKDRTKLLVIESVLSTLLNVVGSVKAIYRYTKDLEYYATRDPLTNLYNQRVFWELANYEIERAKRHNYEFSLLVIDLDNFKSINDSYGHDFGDKFLVEVANLLEHTVRPGDVVARYG
ncbi:diguanylate cyclase, partial [Hydrogenivirga sp. 128-5-R1-1]|uniref:diguanylate cyclase n=1 Tax=Hydrogenivirga sp. 128-5-R1-1 TaxID=392423 RepID=UPI00015F1692